MFSNGKIIIEYLSFSLNGCSILSNLKIWKSCFWVWNRWHFSRTFCVVFKSSHPCWCLWENNYLFNRCLNISIKAQLEWYMACILGAWINHLLPVWWSTFRCMFLRWQLVCKFGIVEWDVFLISSLYKCFLHWPIFIRPFEKRTYYAVAMSVGLSVRPSVHVFWTFLQHALRYQFETWYIHSVGSTTYRVWVASQLGHFDLVYSQK